jgi:hypothetical protein
MNTHDRNAAFASVEVAETGLRRGAGAVGPRHPRRYLAVTWVAATAVGAAFDIPAGLWGAGAIIRFPLPLVIVLAWCLYTRATWRARPRPRGYGRYALPVALAVHAAGFGAATLLGTWLRDAGAPAPFTIAGAAYGTALVIGMLIAGDRLRSRYGTRVARGTDD